MSRNNISILLWLFKAKLNKRGQAPLYIRVSYLNQRRNISTGYYITPERWDSEKYKIKGTHIDALEINEYIQQTRSKLVTIYNDMLKAGDINLDILLERFFGKDINPLS